MSRPDALSGIRVIEVTTAVAGPVAGHILGDMGADVIRVEEPRARALAAGFAPPIEGAPDLPYNRSALFNELNRSKRHVTLDLATPRGVELLKCLVAVSDVLIENFSPRVMPQLGLDFETLRTVNPSLIMISMPAFGTTGPYRDRRAYGPGIDAMSGLSHLSGYADRGPGKPGNYFCDQSAGLHAAFFTLAALRHRRMTGQGQLVELSMIESALQFVAPALMDYLLNGRSQARIGNRHPVRAPQGVYRTLGEDRWIALSVAGDEEWRALCGLIGDDGLTGDARLFTAEGRRAHHEEIDARITTWTSRRTGPEAEQALQEAGISAGRVLDVSQVLSDPQLVHRESFAWVDHPEVGPFPHTRTAWRSAAGNHGVAGPTPLYAEGKQYVFGELLGLTEAEIAELVATEVTSDRPIGFVPNRT